MRWLILGLVACQANEPDVAVNSGPLPWSDPSSSSSASSPPLPSLSVDSTLLAEATDVVCSGGAHSTVQVVTDMQAQGPPADGVLMPVLSTDPDRVSTLVTEPGSIYLGLWAEQPTDAWLLIERPEQMRAAYVGRSQGFDQGYRTWGDFEEVALPAWEPSPCPEVFAGWMGLRSGPDLVALELVTDDDGVFVAFLPPGEFDDRTDGELVFETVCAGCHEEGPGPDLWDVAYDLNAATLESIVRDGTGAMPAQDQLSDAEVDAVVDYVLVAFSP